MSLLLISQAYSQLDDPFTDENEEIYKQDVQPVVKCSLKNIKKLVGVRHASRIKYELRKRSLQPVRNSDDLEIRKRFSFKSKPISKRSCKPSSKRNVQHKLDTNSTVQNKNSLNAPDLYSRAWPFNHLKLVLNFQSEANSSPKKKVSLTTADNWRREGEMFVYYDTLTFADKERLERMNEGYYSCSESEGELEELDDQESEQVAGSNLAESLYSIFTPVKEEKKISKSVGTNAMKHKRENFEDQAVALPVTKNQKRAEDLNKAKIHKNEKSDRRRNSYFEDVLTRFKNKRKQKPIIDKTAVIKLERCDNLVQESRTTTTDLKENAKKTKKRNCKIEEKPFKCTKCSKKFSEFRNLREHEQIVHFGRKPIKCTACPKTFLRQKTLHTHIKEFHSKDGEEKTKCPICFKIFSSIHNLKTHRETVHLKMRPFQCSICLKQFSAKSTLKEHERCHTKENPFESPACKKRFSLRSTLSHHQQTHDATNPLKCSISCREF